MSGVSNVSVGCFVKSSGESLAGSRSVSDSAYRIGRCISGFPSCAFTAPSLNSTIECIIDCGCMIAVICSGRRSKSHFASMISNALFSIVAESIVIFCPIDQFGWCSASATVACCICCFV